MFSVTTMRAAARCTMAAGIAWLTQAPLAVAQAPDLSKVEFRSEKLADNLFALFGGGGNIAVLTGPDGALVVDSDLVELSPKLRAALTMVSEKPARFLINTHFHFDHAGGNPTLGRGGTVIVAHDNVRKHLMTRQVVDVGVDIITEPTPAEGLPVVTFADGLKFHVNGEVVAVNHVEKAHTDSDAFVFFEKANVLHTGDLFMSIGYPFVDGGNGGSLDGLIAAHARALALCNEQTRIIPGHGPLVARADLQAYHDMLVVVRKRISDLVRKGRTLEQVQAAAPTKEYEERWGKGFVKGELFIQRIFIEQNRARK
jgi:glyoxylase-like metal-dependent hydrolase (beta-lactamase superfamily II)